MIDHYYHMYFDARRGLQEQLRESLVSAIMNGWFPTNEPIPSSRRLSNQLSISRNTVALVYESLQTAGYLISRPRSGYYVHPDYSAISGEASVETLTGSPQDENYSSVPSAPDWNHRIKTRPTSKHGLLRPSNWMDFEYPFVHGQPMPNMFPLRQWREISRNTLRDGRDQRWLNDHVDQDDPMLIEQIRTRVLPKRGIWARSDEILVTLGSQNALFLLSVLLMDKDITVAVENPGFRDAVNSFEFQGAKIQLQEVDDQGMVLNSDLAQCDYLYVTPGHQAPTGISMSSKRRTQLLAHIESQDKILIEDDYDAEFHLDNNVLPALKSNDRCGRVIYTSSMSKAFSPGLRMGYVVADAEIIEELRSLRRLMYRHPPLNNQRLLANYINQGYYDTYLRKFREEHYRRSDIMRQAIHTHMSACHHSSNNGANGFWLCVPNDIDTQKSAWAAAQKSILIEPGAQFFFNKNPPKNHMRLGFHALDVKK